MPTSFMQYLALFGTLLCGLSKSQSEREHQVLQLDRDCYSPYFGYVVAPSNCTCKKTNPQSRGQVQWVFPNGTVPKQVSDPQNRSSTLLVESPYKYALNQSYICRADVGPGQKRTDLNHTANFIFGPESPILKWAPEHKDPIYLCRSNETKELKLNCDVPSATINPGPVYTCFIDGKRYGAYDKLGGKLLEETKVWRLEIVFKLNTAGNHTVSCHVRNMYASVNWFVLNQNILVSDHPPPSFQC